VKVSEPFDGRYGPERLSFLLSLGLCQNLIILKFMLLALKTPHTSLYINCF
jgi:hypothetical protein